MSLKAKLGRLDGRGLGQAVADVPVLEPTPRVLQMPLEKALERPWATVHGPVYVSERHHPESFVQGRVRVSGALGVKGETLAKVACDDGLLSASSQDMLFLDTETTGLHGGTGTIPFLVGMAFFEDGALKVEQLFLRRLGEEKPLLQHLASRIENASMLVTYNGKCFDWPLLKSRFVMNRLKAPEVKPHLDLLHVCRRVFKPRLGTARLKELESAVLGHDRGHDIDGALIPQTYFDFLKTQDTGPLETVLSHNVEDLVSLVALLADVARRFEEPSQDDAAHDCLSMAYVAWKVGARERAFRMAEQALRQSSHVHVTAEALSFLALVHASEGAFQQAAEALEEALSQKGLKPEVKARMHLRLAKLYEHRLRKPEEALGHARLCAPAEEFQTHAKRVARLSKRLWAANQASSPLRLRVFST